MKKILSLAALCGAMVITGCATESHQAMNFEQATQSITINRSNSSFKIPVAVGQFANHSDYQNGIFSDGVDRLGSQAQTILLTYLQQAGCYQVLERSNMTALKTESTISKKIKS